MTITQTEAEQRIRAAYGGSDSTRPSFLRPYYVKYNSINKSRDLGETEILVADLNGEIGAEAGASTLYFKVTLPRSVELSVNRRSSGSSTDRFITVGILDADRRPLPLDQRGYATISEDYGIGAGSRLAMPAGVYYITVSSTQWQRIPYAITIEVGRYALLDGAALGSFPARGYIPLVKINGAVGGADVSGGTLLLPNTIKLAAGGAGGSAIPALTLAIMAGHAGGTMLPSGRLMMNWKLSGSAAGSNQTTGTLSSEAPYGGGYGY